MSQVKERPILFSAPMVRAILDARKTVTRRAISYKLTNRFDEPRGQADVDAGYPVVECEEGYFPATNFCPFGQPGDRLWVREACRYPASLDHYSPSAIGEKALDAGYNKPWCPTHFEADGARNDGWQGFETPPAVSVPGKLRPPMFMPRWASRILLEITDVRVERLQDITYEQAAAEGVHRGPLREWCASDEGGACHKYPIPAFRDLWQSTGGDWDANPWVWVVEFKRVTP